MHATLSSAVISGGHRSMNVVIALMCLGYIVLIYAIVLYSFLSDTFCYCVLPFISFGGIASLEDVISIMIYSSFVTIVGVLALRKSQMFLVPCVVWFAACLYWTCANIQYGFIDLNLIFPLVGVVNYRKVATG